MLLTTIMSLSSGQIMSIVIVVICMYLGFKKLQQPDVPRPAVARPVETKAASAAKLTPAERFLAPSSTKQRVCVSTTSISELVGTELVVKSETLPVLWLLAKHSDLHFVTQCPTLATEKQVSGMLERSGLYEAGLKRHRVLFCTKQPGKSAIVRHLEPALFVDDDVETLVGLLPYLPLTVHISSQNGLVGSKASVSASLQDYFYPSNAP